jgi:hypothetical protein
MWFSQWCTKLVHVCQFTGKFYAVIIVKVQKFLSYIQSLAFLHTIRMTANITGALSRPWMFLQRQQYLHNISKQSLGLERSGGFADDSEPLSL